MSSSDIEYAVQYGQEAKLGELWKREEDRQRAHEKFKIFKEPRTYLDDDDMAAAFELGRQLKDEDFFRGKTTAFYRIMVSIGELKDKADSSVRSTRV